MPSCRHCDVPRSTSSVLPRQECDAVWSLAVSYVIIINIIINERHNNIIVNRSTSR